MRELQTLLNQAIEASKTEPSVHLDALIDHLTQMLFGSDIDSFQLERTLVEVRIKYGDDIVPCSGKNSFMECVGSGYVWFNTPDGSTHIHALA